MTLPIRLDGLVRDGVVADHADLARLGHVTWARLTQQLGRQLHYASVRQALDDFGEHAVL